MLSRSFRIALFFAFCLVFLLPEALPAQGYAAFPKREFRAVWVTTVFNNDYPRRPTDWDVALREQWKQLLDRYQDIGFNAVIVQVRAAGDAFYPTELAPWSKFLTGVQGKPPRDGYDPLAVMIAEAHRRGMEFHAWFNPYRATTNLDTLALASNHAFYQHRDWMVRYGGKFYFNPALPQVREHITQVVAEVVDNYDIDAVHFDDYFYPYRNAGELFPDSLDFLRYGRAYPDIEDWRRSNIDAMIESVFLQIKKSKRHVRFGVSPFGVWRNRDRDPLGSETRAGATTYDDLYADVRKWLRLGWVDYVIPQLYWHIGFEPADYEKLLKWWSVNTYDRHLFVGHAAYKVENNPELAWFEPGEIPRQIQLERRNFISRGGAFFSSRWVLQNRLGLRDSLQTYYRYPALVPEMEGLSQAAKTAPDFRRVGTRQGYPRLKWRPAKVDRDRTPFYYVVYRFEDKEPLNLQAPENILHVSPFNQEHKKIIYVDRTAQPGKTYTYVVTAFNRQHSESKPSEARRVEKTETGVRRRR